MEQIQPFADERHDAFCASCGASPGTRDHSPPKVFLDTPYPDNLPTAWTCHDCNEGHSLDEEYVACLVECVKAGTTDPARLRRPTVRRVLAAKPALRERLTEAHQGDHFVVEHGRVNRVVLKLARCHAKYELAEPMLDPPTRLATAPLPALSQVQSQRFETAPEAFGWPEVGSRAMARAIGGASDANRDPYQWVIVQQARYRYLAVPAPVCTVRMILSEYLAAEVAWS